MSAGKPGKAGERRSWSLRGPVPGLVCDTRENGKVIRMRSVSVVRELQRTLRKGPRWEGKRNHSLQGRNPEGSGRRPQGLGGARQTRTRVGRKKQGATGQGEEGGRPGLGVVRTHEAGKGSSARSSRVGAGGGKKGVRKKRAERNARKRTPQH